jgi:hypothetical protein
VAAAATAPEDAHASSRAQNKEFRKDMEGSTERGCPVL